MAITPVTNNTKFPEWLAITNALIDALGDNDALSTTNQDSLVGALNEVLTNLGDITTLTTSDKSSTVNAILELVINIGALNTLDTTEKASLVGSINEVVGNAGDLTTLTTTIKTSLVNAINELNTSQSDGFTAVANDLGDKNTLTTTEKGTFVGAINELVTNAGDLTTLTTTDKTSLVNAIIELVTGVGDANTRIDTEVGDLSSLTTTAKSSVVEALNEVLSGAGDNTTLTTSDKTSLVNAINEVNQNQVTKSHIPYPNLEINHGRFSTDVTRVLTTFDGSQSHCLKETNASAITEGDRFIDDNSDHGGANGTLGTDVAQLMTKIFTSGRTDNQNGYEFYVMNVTAGGGTANGTLFSTRNYYPVVATDDLFIGAIGSKVTFQCWIRLKTLANALDNGILLGDSTVDTYVDDTLVSDEHILTTGDGWVHLRQTTTLTNEFKTLFPIVKGNVGDVVQFALPALFNADIDNGMHLGVL